MNFRKKIREYANVPITRHLILDLLKDYNRPNDKISELIKNEELISLKRGLYVVGNNLDLPKPDTFLIANHLRGPSYVSIESALSYYGLIPERVFEISSVTTKISKKYRTPSGRYSYSHLPLPYYTFGIQYVEIAPKQFVLIASPEKAICDKIILTSKINFRSTNQVKSFLIEDLRMGKEDLRDLNLKMIETWLDDAPKRNSIKMLINTIREL
jgi:hypothetical protein